MRTGLWRERVGRTSVLTFHSQVSPPVLSHFDLVIDLSPPSLTCPHCPIRVSTRPAWHSKFYAWLFLLWPRLIQNSCWINLKGGAFWENLSSVVTSLDSWKTNWEIKKRTFLLAIRGINVNIVTTTEILIPVQAFLKAFIASYFLFLGDIQCWPNKTQRFYFHQG